MDVIGGLNKNATRMLTGFIMGTIAMFCIIKSGIALLLMLVMLESDEEIIEPGEAGDEPDWESLCP